MVAAAGGSDRELGLRAAAAAQGCVAGSGRARCVVRCDPRGMGQRDAERWIAAWGASAFVRVAAGVRFRSAARSALVRLGAHYYRRRGFDPLVLGGVYVERYRGRQILRLHELLRVRDAY